MDYRAPEQVNRYRSLSLIVGVVGLVLAGVGFAINREQFYHSYLFGFIFWVGVALGCLVILLIGHSASGSWSVVTRRAVEAGASTFWLCALLFIPVVLSFFVKGEHPLYLWSDQSVVDHDHVLKLKSGYLNVGFFLIRSLAFFICFIFISYRLLSWSRQQDEASDPGEYKKKMRNFSAPMLVLVIILMTFASVDWLMSLDPHWTSTIFGILFLGDAGLSAISFLILAMILLSKYPPLSEYFVGRSMHDISKLMFAFTLFWAYFSLSQFLIIWAGNLPEEIPWYINRLSEGWKVIAGAIVLLHFVVPFFILLPRRANRSRRIMVAVATIMFVMRIIDTFWMVGPSEYDKRFHVSWMDIVIPIGIGGIWLWAFFTHIKSRPVLPINEPKLEEAYAVAHSHH
jgi:hypothetical protein